MTSENEKTFYAGKIYDFSLVVLLCLLPIIGIFLPRLISVLPPFIGLLFFAASWIKSKQRPYINKKIFLFIGAVMGLTLLSCVWSIDREESLDRCLKMALVIIPGGLLLNLALYSESKIREQFLKYFPLAVILALAFCVLDLYTGGLLYNLGRGIPQESNFNFSNLNRPIVIAIFSLIPALACLYQTGRKSYTLLLGSILILLALAMLYKTDSQSAHLAFIIALLTYFLFPVNWKSAWYGLGIIIAALIFSTPWLTQYLFHALLIAKFSSCYRAHLFLFARY